MWYQTGTVTTVNGSASVLGVGTTWASQVKIGDILTIDRATYYKVATVVSDTELALASPYLGPSAAGQIYAIVVDFNNAAANWLQAAIGLLTPPDRVASVFGRTGEVTAQSGDYAAAQVSVVPVAPLKASDVQGALAELALEKAPLISPAFVGTPTAPTPETGDVSGRLATTAFVKAQGYITAGEAPVLSVAGKTGVVTLDVADVGGAAPLASPVFTGTPTGPTAAVTTNSAQLATTAFVKAQSLNDFAAPTGALSINGQRLTDLSDPAAAQDAATKAYVDSVAQGLDAKASVRAATTANIALTGTPIIDGVALAPGDRVLVKNQTAPAENGIYVGAAGTWTRAADADTWNELVSAYVFVEDGTVNANAGFTCTVKSGGTIGVTPVTWVQFSGAGQVIAGTGLLKDGNTLSVDTSVIAALASPTLTGTPTAPTASAATNTTQIATTAFVKSQGYITATQAPVLSVAGKTGVVTLAVTDVSGAAPLASPALTGTPTAPTAAVATNSTQIATTAFVKSQGYITAGQAPVLSVAGRTGVVTLAVADVAGAAPAASPVLTGTPTAPTAALGTSSSQLATTAFVLAQVNAGGGMAWQTKSSSFAAVVATGYFVDTSTGPVVATLPASPTIGDQVRFADVASTFGINKLTVARAGLPIMGLNEDMDVSTTYATVHLVYSGASQGWRLLF